MVNIVNLTGLKSADQVGEGSTLDVFTRVFPQRTKGEPAPDWQGHSSLGARGKGAWQRDPPRALTPPLRSLLLLSSPLLLFLAPVTRAPPTLDELKPLETKTQDKPLLTFACRDGDAFATTHTV